MKYTTATGMRNTVRQRTRSSKVLPCHSQRVIRSVDAVGFELVAIIVGSG